mmetsp:Transcript_157645/g.382743  ORF Transcript_157645/g.382743 Transcript_157645/m.382743 type:complete len:404 (+) Transcript_157645:44-1255(+)
MVAGILLGTVAAVGVSIVIIPRLLRRRQSKNIRQQSENGPPHRTQPFLSIPERAKAEALFDEIKDKNILDLVTKAADAESCCMFSETDISTTSFTSKKARTIGDASRIEALGIGFSCRKGLTGVSCRNGLTPEGPNQDSWIILSAARSSIYGVFDGHGQNGHDISDFVKENLPKLLLKDERFWSPDEDKRKSMCIDAFGQMQKLIALQDDNRQLSGQLSSTTATIVIHDRVANKLTVAHIGPCETALVSRTEANKRQAIRLTTDHKPEVKEERARIEASGGRVVYDGYAHHHVYAKEGRYPGLNMSRCFGDLLGHRDCGIISEPEVSFYTITDNDDFLLIASDGVMEFMAPQEVVDRMPGSREHSLQECCDKLAKEAWDRWIHEETGTFVDDITVIVAYLGSP